VATNITIDEAITNVNVSGGAESTPAYTIVTLSNDQGPQGPTGATGSTGATGATGATGSSGVIGVDVGELTNTGTPSAAQLGLATAGTAGEYTKVTTDSFGRITSGTTLSAGDVPTLNQNTTGNAATATALATARNINGVSFNGTADITVADATKAPLTGATFTGAITATDITDSTMTTAGVVTNTSAGLLGSTTTVPVANGGTGSTTAATARTNLEIVPSYLPFVSGGYYKTVTGANTTAAASGNNRLDLTNFYVPTTTTFSNIGITSSTLTVSGTVRLGIYSDNAGFPGSKIYESAAITTAATGNTFITPTSFSQTLTPGWYWLGAVTQSVTGTFWMTQTASPSIAYNQRTTSQPSATYPSGVSGFQITGVTGALPATGASALASVVNLLITFLVAA